MTYLKTLGITNCDQLFETLASVVRDPIMTRPQLIYLYGRGGNGKSKFIETVDEAIERLSGYLPFMISSENLSLTNICAEVATQNPSNIIHLSEVYDPVRKLRRILDRLEKWSVEKDINRCYIMTSNVPLDDDMKKKVIYCEFPNTFVGSDSFDVTEEMIQEVMTKLMV